MICVSSYETTSSEDSSGEEDQDEVEEVDSSEPEVEQGEESGTAQEEAAATGEQGDGVQAEVAEGSEEPDAGQAAMSPQEEQPVRWDGGPCSKELQLQYSFLHFFFNGLSRQLGDLWELDIMQSTQPSKSILGWSTWLLFCASPLYFFNLLWKAH